jgi:hypothetical protein
MRNSETRTSKTAFRNSCFARACTSALRFPVMAGNQAKCNRKLRYNSNPQIGRVTNGPDQQLLSASLWRCFPPPVD